MNYYTQKCLEQFSPTRRKIIVKLAKMTRQTVEASISDAWILNDIESDFEFKKQLNNQLQKNFLGDIKCGATGCAFVGRFSDDGEGEDASRGHHSSTLDVLIGMEVGLAGLGQSIKTTSKSLAADLRVCERHARRMKKKQAALAEVQVGLFEFDGGGV